MNLTIDRPLRTLMTAPVAGVLVAFLAASPAAATDGSLDPIFDGDGRVITDLTIGGEGVTGVAVLPDGKIVAVGDSAGDFTIVRYLRNGALDPSFGSGDGIASVDFGSKDTPWDVALQADGKIVIAGETGGYPAKVALARLDVDGNPDAGFGSAGKVISDLGGSQSARGVAIQASGRIIIAGNRFTDPGGNDFIVAGYEPDGSLDTTFGSGGAVTTDFTVTGDYYPSDDVGQDVALDAADGIVVAGTAGRRPSEYGNMREFAVARYDSDGDPDLSFSGDGKVRTNLGPLTMDQAHAVAIQADGRIVVAGSTYDGYDPDFGLVRYLADGDLDTSFGDTGTVSTGFDGPDDNDTAWGVTIQGDGKIVAAGTASYSFYPDFAVARYEVNGSLDPTFADGGLAMTDFGPGGQEHASSVALQPDGNIVVAGSTWSNGTGYSAFALARYLSAGGGEPQAALVIDPTTEAFGDVPTGSTSAPATFTVTNDGGATAEVTAVDIVGPDESEFSISDGDCLGDIVAGGTCTIDVVFEPTSEGAKGAQLVVTSDADVSGWPTSADLAGSGVAPDVAQPDAKIAKRSAAGPFKGDDVYGTRPTPSQTMAWANLDRGETVEFWVALQNDGDATDSFTVQATMSGSGAKVSYWHGDDNVSGRVRAGTWDTGDLAPTQQELLRVRVRINDRAGAQVIRTVVLQATSSNDPGKVDVVRARARR